MKKKSLLLAALMTGSAVFGLATEANANAKGADISWITEMEDNGVRFYNDNGVEQDVIATLKEHGMDSIRLRVWVNPADGWYSSIDDVIEKAIRAQNAGMRIMIDFHYSDTWADPAHQTKPAAWSSYDLDGLMTAVWWHTYDSLTAIKNAGITPEWVQVGNETNNGMLWDEGKASENMQSFAWLVNSGHNATKEVFPNAKTIVHLANCHDNANFRWIFDGLYNNGANYDVIGASNYPTNATGITWQEANEQCLSNLNDMVSRYGKDVMITEIGVPWDHTESKTIVSDMINKLDQVTDSRSLGVFYWEPQAQNFNGYTLGAWDPNTGRPTQALDAFLGSGSGTGNATFNGTYRIAPAHSGKAIDVAACNGNNGGNLQQWTWLSNDCQKFNVTQVDGEWHRISPVVSPNRALDVDSFSTNPGANVMLWDYWGSNNQLFRFQNAGSGQYRIINRNSQLCLDIFNNSTSDGANLMQWNCLAGATNQMFQMISQ